MTPMYVKDPCNTFCPQKSEDGVTNGGFYTWGLEGIIKQEKYGLGKEDLRKRGRERGREGKREGEREGDRYFVWRLMRERVYRRHSNSFS